jgi:hypothetical protein
MYKLLFILAIGIAIGYGYGWKDAQVNDKAVYERIVDRIGGNNKELMRADVDAKMRTVSP